MRPLPRLINCRLTLIVALTIFFAACSVRSGPRDIPSLASVGPHPAAQALDEFFASPMPAGITQTGLTKKDYLRLIAGNVDHFKQYQRADGAIIDPIARREIQYSTPAFAE